MSGAAQLGSGPRFYLDPAHRRIQTAVDHLCRRSAMKLRRRGTPSRPGDRGLLLQGAAAAAEGDRGSTLSLAEGPETTGGVVGEAREEGRPALSSWSWPQTVWGASGLLVALLLALTQACWVNSIHENLLWFSQLTEVEREISFRTECGLYYSYYKQLLQAPSIQEGLSALIHDNLTESKRTINLLQRMNIYQEVALSLLYRLLPVQEYLEPVYFYIYTVFSLQAVYVMALYLTAWLLSGSWLAGALAGVWYILNRVDTTRVEFTISLRENWSLPFLALQVAAITWYLRPHISALQQKVAVWLMFVTTLCFCLTWQFNQFILLIQALIIYSLDCVDILTSAQVTTLYLVQVSGLLTVWLLQFCNSMLLGSLVLSFISAALLARCWQPAVKKGGLLLRLGKLLLHSLLVLLLTGAINFLAKKVLQLESDEHIFKFIQSKFGFGPTRDFDASLYLCEEAFGTLPLDTLERLTGTLLLPPYILTLLLLTASLAAAVLHNLRSVGVSAEQKRATGGSEGPGVPRVPGGPEGPEGPGAPRGHGGPDGPEGSGRSGAALRPDVAYNLLHSVFYGLLAFSTMRMKYLWTGHMCALASSGVCGPDLCPLLLRALRCHSPGLSRFIRCAVPLVIMGLLYYKFWPQLMEELSEMREFYDPDTVELMTWISSNTPQRTVFAGSMQLLAAVKLCTGRVVTNHPHYEDKQLRDRTRQVYQVYACRSPEEVHGLLRASGADFLVLENSICYERRHRRGCRLRDLLDLDNGHIMDGPGENDPDLVTPPHPRFCEAVQTEAAPYTSLFTRVFQNKTFHVYRLKKRRRKSSKEAAAAQ